MRIHVLPSTIWTEQLTKNDILNMKFIIINNMSNPIISFNSTALVGTKTLYLVVV